MVTGSKELKSQDLSCPSTPTFLKRQSIHAKANPFMQAILADDGNVQ